MWGGGTAGEAEQLASAYRSALSAASELGVVRVAFPAISTGIYGYPLDEATAIAIETTTAFLVAHERPETVLFCCFDAATEAAYRTRLER
jgi:O-acetyl-ADP-ribose deacetylase (regulator of RNase III)